MANSRDVILLVEHEVSVRKYIRMALADNGYTVLEAPGGLEAMAVMLRYEGQIALAIVEIIMPGVSGLDFANQLQIDRPKTEILYISASADSVAVDSILRRKPESMLAWPFTGDELVERVGGLLAARRASARSPRKLPERSGTPDREGTQRGARPVNTRSSRS